VLSKVAGGGWQIYNGKVLQGNLSTEKDSAFKGGRWFILNYSIKKVFILHACMKLCAKKSNFSNLKKKLPITRNWTLSFLVKA
jgi:hypothetical protein